MWWQVVRACGVWRVDLLLTPLPSTPCGLSLPHASTRHDPTASLPPRQIVPLAVGAPKKLCMECKNEGMCTFTWDYSSAWFGAQEITYRIVVKVRCVRPTSVCALRAPFWRR